jgi:Mg-chelatase subunit ChlI
MIDWSYRKNATHRNSEKKMLYGKMYATRRRGRPKMRWLDDVSTDLRKMGINEWRHKGRDREAWRRNVKGAKAHPGCSAIEEEEEEEEEEEAEEEEEKEEKEEEGEEKKKKKEKKKKEKKKKKKEEEEEEKKMKNMKKKKKLSLLVLHRYIRT